MLHKIVVDPVVAIVTLVLARHPHQLSQFQLHNNTKHQRAAMRRHIYLAVTSDIFSLCCLEESSLSNQD